MNYKKLKRKKEISKLIYNHPLWLKRKNQIISRDEKCSRCSSITNLQVHHKWYKKQLFIWDYPDNCLEVLCKTCHIEEHNSNSIQHYFKLGLKQEWKGENKLSFKLIYLFNLVYKRKIKPIASIYIYRERYGFDISSIDLKHLSYISGIRQSELKKILLVR